MHVLVLSCNTGGGHNSAGSAVLEALQARGHTGERVDFLGLAGQKVSDLVCGAYVGMVKNLPAVFGVTYSVGRAVSTAGAGTKREIAGVCRLCPSDPGAEPISVPAPLRRDHRPSHISGAGADRDEAQGDGSAHHGGSGHRLYLYPVF